MACRWREAAQLDPDYLAEVEERVLKQMEMEAKGEQIEDDVAQEWRPPAREFNITSYQLNRVISLLGDLIRAQGADIDPDDYMFPTPLDPWSEARARAEYEQEQRQIQNAFAKLLGG